MKISTLFVVFAVLSSSVFAQKKGNLKITFKEGESSHVKVTEELQLTQQMSQVDSELVEPSIRISVYNFTETVEKVHPDGSALIAATLDSFTTNIFLAKIEGRNEYFRFNSNNEYDLANRLKDARALPRAQFLGQTLRYTLGADGLVKNFQNLSGFQEASIARSYEYDMLHAVMSFADSLRIGQLLEEGFGGVAALSDGNTGEVSTPYTMTEIHVTRKLKAEKKGDTISFSSTFSDVPDKIEYIEGIAFPMDVHKFSGKSNGAITFKDGKVIGGSETESAKMELTVENEIIKNAFERHITFEREPIKLIYRSNVNVKLIDEHRAKPKAAELPPDDPNAKVIHITPDGIKK